MRKLYAERYSIEEITRITGHIKQTVKKYLDKNCLLYNGHCDNGLPGKLAPYEKEVLNLRAQGVKYSKIHETISSSGS